MRRLPLLFACLFCCHALHAQLPDLTVSGDTLYSPEAKTYQWLRDGVEIPGATERFHVPTAAGSYAVRIRSLDSEAQSFGFGRTLAVAGAVLDEFLRPVAGAEVTVGGRLTQTDADGRFFVMGQRTERMSARASMPGYHAHTVGFRPTGGETQFVYIHLAKQVVTHKLPANTGGTISQGGFWLTLPPNAVVDETGLPYKGEIQLSVVARRPGDRDFAQRMPGGDFMAEDKAGEAKVLYSYGFTGVEMTTADGKPLNLAPDSVAVIEFLITEDQRPGAPAEMPLWHFDEDKGLWVESGTVRKEGLTYKAEVGHFSWWNCDRPYPPAYVEGNVVDCKGNPVTGGVIAVNQREAYTDSEGSFNGAVPATIELHIHIANTDTTIGPLAANERRLLGTFNAGWGAFQAVGLADTNRILTVYAYGAMEGVEYSLDGEHWQSEPVFVLQNDSVPLYGWARVEGCAALSFKNHQPVYFNNCLLLDSAALAAMPKIYSLEQLIGAKEPVYCVYVHLVDIFTGSYTNAFTAAAKGQPCVQSASLWGALNPPDDYTDRLNRVLSLWLNLQELYMEYSLLTRVPESLGGLINLRRLDIGNNQLTSIPESMGNLTNLTELILNFNQIPTLPASLGNLVNLQLMDINSNQLSSLPQAMKNLIKLQTLNLSYNQFEDLPEVVSNLTGLQTLHLAYNKLTSVPEALGNLTNLRTLYLNYNKLTTLPASFANLADTLQTLNLTGNPITPEEQARIRAMLPNTTITF